MTPDERRRIYEEEKARVDAQLQIKAEARRERGKRTGRVLGYLILVFVVIGFVFWAVSYYRYYDSITMASLDAKAEAKRAADLQADIQKARADVIATGGNPDSINDPRLDAEVPKLFGLPQRFDVEDGYCIVEGEVKNISPDKMANVEAVVTFYDKNNDVVKTDDALIEYNPILPGQTSPFKVVTSGNPAIVREVLNFAYLNGMQIPMTHR